MTQHNESLIDRLLKLWYSLIGGDHHKDRDCWFFIEREYCTYKPATWTVRHQGYIRKDYIEQFDSFGNAQSGLIDYLIEACAEEISLVLQQNQKDSQQLHDDYMDTLQEIVLDVHYMTEKK